ncbi:MAG: sensor histidine kinase [Candidatus Kurthia intestinigallinarum]
MSMRKQLIWRTVVIFIILYGCLALLLGAIFKYSMHVEQQQLVDGAVQNIQFNDQKVTEESQHFLAQQFPTAKVVIDGQQILALRGPHHATTDTRVFEQQQQGHHVEISFPLHEENELMMTQLMIFTSVVAVLFIIAFLFYRRIIEQTLAPLNALNTQVRQLSAETMHDKVAVPHAPLEVKELEQSVQHMQDRLQSAFEKEYATQQMLQQFVSDASHELKTPLTSIQGFTEILLRSPLDNVQQIRQSIEQIRTQATRMTKLTEHLLQLAHLDREEPLQCEEISLDDLLKDLAPILNMLNENYTIHYMLQSPLPISVDVMKIQQVILNLVQNAIRYSPINTTVTIKTYGYTVEVLDEGEGIASAHLAHIFERFYRIDKHRARQSGGEGLGLAICKSIMEQHGGQIRVASTVGVGTCFTLIFPFK